MIGRRLGLAVGALALIAAACGGSDDEAADTACLPEIAPGISLETGEYDGVERTWQLAGPEQDQAVGIIVDLHGTTGTIEVHDSITRMSAEGPARGYVVVTPQGLENPTRWTVPGIPGPDDVAFIDALVGDIRRTGCIFGPAFVTGKSSGAAMATQLSCETDTFTAIAPIGGVSLYRPCWDEPPVSLLAIHGTDDAWVPYVGPPGHEEVEAQADTFYIGDVNHSVNSFAGRAGCEDTTTTTELGADTTIAEFDQCEPPHRVVLYTVEGGGHTHPGQHALDTYEAYGSTEAVGSTTTTFDGTDVILDFFDSMVEAVAR